MSASAAPVREPMVNGVKREPATTGDNGGLETGEDSVQDGAVLADQKPQHGKR